MVDSRQMQMAFMQEGGIKDDGMQVDPVSGNEIPPGSMASEVRDDIPAMLSEGEYVVPADVLRYYGVNFFEGLRNKAKQGLSSMEQNGRIGGEPLTPQQIQQNMSGAPQAGQPAPMPVQANEGVLAQQQQMASGFNPMNYGTVGFSTFQPSGPPQESITTFKTWVHKDTGEQRVIEYIDGRPRIEEPPSPPFFLFGSAELTAAKAQQQASNNNDDGGKPPTETETEPDTSWMDGIDFNDAKSIGDSAKSILGLSTGEKAGIGLAGAVAGLPGLAAGKTAVDAMSIAQARALEQYARNDLKDENLANEIEENINKTLEGNKVLGWLDETFPNLMPGTKKYDEIINAAPSAPAFEARAARQRAEVAKNAASQKAKDDAAAAAALKAAQSNNDDDDPFKVTDVEIDRDPMGQMTQTTTYEGIDPGLTTADEDGLYRGGLMARKKSKNKK